MTCKRLHSRCVLAVRHTHGGMTSVLQLYKDSKHVIRHMLRP